MYITEYKNSEIRFFCAVDKAPNPNKADYQLHTHNHHEIYIFLEGKGSYIVEGSEYKLRPGSTLIFRTGEAHMLKINTSEPYKRIVISFSNEFVKKTDPLGKLLIPFMERPLGKLNYYGNLLGVEHLIDISNKHFDEEYLQNLVICNAINNILLEIFLGFEDKKNNLTDNSKDELIYRIVDYVNKKLYEDVSLEKISKHFFLSKSQLNRNFKRFTGSTVWEYITAKRLLRAQQLIRDGETASRACALSGFEDYSAFFRAYKNRFGITPKEEKHR